MDRRSVLKSMVMAGAAAMGAPNPLAGSTKQGQGGHGDHDFSVEGLGMLYDATLCIGCKVCMVACRESNGLELPPDTDLWYDPPDLSSEAITIIKLYEGEEGGDFSFVKRQCMHCVDPACVAACPFTAMYKAEDGVVSWDPERCVGCRYCEIGCPFNVPKFEWESRNPRIVKCQLCSHRLAEGGIPACVEECPRDAILFGTREELLEEARRRIATEPDRYHPRIYGEHEAGGTQVLYISRAGIDPGDLGLPALDDTPLPENVRNVQGILYKGMIAPLALYAALGFTIAKNRKAAREDAEEAGTVGYTPYDDDGSPPRENDR